MAVYQGARPRGLTLPFPGRPTAGRRAPASEGSIRRGRVRVGVAPRRIGRLGSTLGLIVVLFLIGFVWLAQSVQVSATSYDIVRLASQHDRLQGLARDLESDLSRLGGQPAIRKLALDAGLGQLDAPIVLPAR
jgi:hypothetical protein